ncbi:MAG: ABC transporter permease [Chloroflexi bacterium]|nr:ABC transporter permease [Chloroflexota bacterium]
MRTYILRRVVLTLPTLFAITIVVFGAVRFLPGNILDSLLGVDAPSINAETRAEMAKRYGFDQNIVVQYAVWLDDLAHANLGRSFISGRPVLVDLAPRIPVTVELSLLGIIISLLISLPVGMLAAVKQNSIIDYVSRSLSIASLSIPSFWLGLVVIVFGFILFRWTPPLQYTPPWQDLGTNLKILWVPALILGTALSGITMRYTRTTMLEILNLDYVRTGRAKGLPERIVVTRHALPNALIPVVTVVGLQMPLLVGGTVVLEQIFSIPGMGSYLLNSIQQRDYPVVQAIVLMTAVVVVVTNVVVDLAYAILDPRVEYA